MALSYDELLRRVPTWIYAGNRRLVDEMPTIIEQAEDQMLQVLDHDIYQTTLTGFTVGPGVKEIDLTANDPRVLEVRSIRVANWDTDTWQPCQLRDLEYLTALFSDGRTGRPRYYATRGEVLRFELFPAPDHELQVEITANVEFTRLGPDQQTNVLTIQFPRALEKAALRQAAIFMNDPQNEQRYETEFIAALNESNAQVGRRRRDEVGNKPRDTHNATGV